MQETSLVPSHLNYYYYTYQSEGNGKSFEISGHGVDWGGHVHPSFLREDDPEFEIYIRFTTTQKAFLEQVEIWPIKSIKLFFQKKFANLLVVLDDENKQDHEYGDKFHKLHPDLNTRVCYMKSLPHEYYHSWGKARMYMDMMHADVCSTKEYVGFIDVDTLFVTAVTKNLLFEEKKPIISGRIGIPRIPCWIQTGQYILGMKQVVQCMSYFPVTFKVSHIVEMRKHVERIHNKSFAQVFKEAPEAVKVPGVCYCHFSVMCNYMWYFHRDEYAWHLQLVPGGKWNNEGGIPSMVDANYFNNYVKASEKIPIPRSSVHARHLMIGGKYRDAIAPSEKITNSLIREGLCYSFGLKLCPNSCFNVSETVLHDSLFAFENYRWQWDQRCMEMQLKHYQQVNKISHSNPKSFIIDLEPSQLCSTIRNLS
eukprot:gene11885-biopygen9521